MNRDNAIEIIRQVKVSEPWTVQQDMASRVLGLDPDNYRTNHSESWPEHMRGKSTWSGPDILKHMTKIEEAAAGKRLRDIVRISLSD